MQTDLTAFSDAALIAGNMFNAFDSVKSPTPTVLLNSSYLNLTAYTSSLNFSSTNALIGSVQIKVQLDITKMLPASTGASSGNKLMDILGVNINDYMAMLNPTIAYLSAGLSDYKDLTVSMSGTNISGLMDGSVAKGILSLFKLNDKPMLDFVKDIIQTVMNLIFDDKVLVLKDLINPNLD
jgi:hypothetical protein